MSHYLEKSHSGIQEISIRTKQLNDGIIYITGEINQESLIHFTEELLYVQQNPSIFNIYIIISSIGGSVTSGLSMIDQMLQSTKPISTLCLSEAYSMAAILLSAGQKRYILPHAKVMIHEPLIERTGGSATSISKTATSILATKEELVRLLCQFTHQPKEIIEENISFDNMMTAQEAVSFGLCDEILEKPIVSWLNNEVQ